MSVTTFATTLGLSPKVMGTRSAAGKLVRDDYVWELVIIRTPVGLFPKAYAELISGPAELHPLVHPSILVCRKLSRSLEVA